MSYILEALRKANAERERGSVPDLHAQLLPLGVSDAEVAPARSLATLWLGLGAGLALVAGAAWFLWGRDEPAAAAPPVVASAAPAVAAPPPAPPIAASAPPAPVAAVPARQGASGAATEPPAPKPLAKPKPKPMGAASAPAKVAPRPKPPAPAPQAEPPGPPPRLPPLAELPVELRQQVPQLVIGGFVYSPQASARMVVINGQVFQEGNSLAPELKLEQIRQKTAVFSIRGQRFEVPL